MQTCTKCGRELPATREFFFAQKRRKSGLQAQCKECTNARASRYNEEHREQRRVHARVYYAIHADEIKERNKGYSSAYYEARRTRQREEGYAPYYETHREERLAYQHEYYQLNGPPRCPVIPIYPSQPESSHPKKGTYMTTKTTQYEGLKPIMCHFEPEVHEQMKAVAKSYHRSLKAQSEMILLEALEAELAKGNSGGNSAQLGLPLPAAEPVEV